MAKILAARPFNLRPLDLLYFSFFCIHIPATVLCDLQAFYNREYLPAFIRGIPEYYVEMSHDPMMAASLGLNGPMDRFIWFKTFLGVEALFQLPAFVIGAYTMWNDILALYPILLVYAVSACTTTLPCLTTILSLPIDSTPSTSKTLMEVVSDLKSPATAPLITSLTPMQLAFALSCHGPFMLLPTIMAVDMAMRVSKLVKRGLEVQRSQKVE